MGRVFVEGNPSLLRNSRSASVCSDDQPTGHFVQLGIMNEPNLRLGSGENLDALDGPDDLYPSLKRGPVERVAHLNVLHADCTRNLLTGGGEVECSPTGCVGWNTLAEWNGLLGVVAPCCEQIIVKAKLLGLRNAPRGKVLTSDAVMVFRRPFENQNSKTLPS
jgi:hypothetical protein